MRGRTPSEKCHSWQKLFFLVFDFSRVKFRTIFFAFLFQMALSVHRKSLLKWLKVFFLLFICVASCSTHSRSTFLPANLVPEVAPFRNRQLFSSHRRFSTLFFLLSYFSSHKHNPSTHAQILHIAATSVKSGILVPKTLPPLVKTSGTASPAATLPLLEPTENHHFDRNRDAETNV